MAKKTIFEDCDVLVVGGGMAGDRKSTRLNSSTDVSRMPSSA